MDVFAISCTLLAEQVTFRNDIIFTTTDGTHNYVLMKYQIAPFISLPAALAVIIFYVAKGGKYRFHYIKSTGTKRCKLLSFSFAFCSVAAIGL
jgi:hypothetical protein